MKIAFLTAGGPFGLLALEALRSDHEIVAVVRPSHPAPSWKRLTRTAAQRLGLRHRDVVREATRGSSIPVIQAGRDDSSALSMALEHVRPDLLCIATFPWLLAPEILDIPTHGVVNLHPSYLPRHRGPNPLYWTYYHDDRRGGVTAHLAEAEADTGPILVQESIDIPRGLPSGDLYLAMASAGARVVREAVDQIADGAARPVPQAHERSTRAPRVKRGTPMIEFGSWDVERVWHYLAGLNPWYKEPLTTTTGRLVRYGDVRGFARGAPAGVPGHAHSTRDGWILECRDGQIHLGRRSLAPSALRIANATPT